MRGGIRAFLLGAEPRERDLSGVHRSEEGGENREEEDEGKEGRESGGGAGGGSSTDTVRGPRREENKRWTARKMREGKEGGRREVRIDEKDGKKQNANVEILRGSQ